MIDLGGREFKLLLQPVVLGGKDGLEGAKHFKGLLRQSVLDILGDGKTGEPRCQGKFATDERRTVRFWDDEKDRLRSGDFFVRTRRDADADWKGNGERELTLKYRTEDVALAAVAHTMMRGGNHAMLEDDSKTKFEEDIAPRQIGHRPKAQPVVRPTSPGTRSRFSVSCKTELEKAEVFDVGDVVKVIPAFARCYRMATGTDLDEKAKLRRGPKVREQTFGGVSVQLGGDIAAECCLTIWDFPDRAGAGGDALPPPRIVEFSYKVSLGKESWSEDAARRVRQLFLGLQVQKSLPSELRFSSKTEFALP